MVLEAVPIPSHRYNQNWAARLVQPELVAKIVTAQTLKMLFYFPVAEVLIYFVLLGVDAQTGTQEVSFGVRQGLAMGANWARTEPWG